jgi:hypothetical protein
MNDTDEMNETSEAAVLRIGDQMRISVELMLECVMAPEVCSPIVTVRDIQREADGTKVIVVERQTP